MRRISFDDLRDATEAIALADISDDELAERGVPLDQDDELLDGLGPSHYTLIELGTGEQYLLHRLDLAPPEGRGVNIEATLTGDADGLTDRLMLALDLPVERVTWRVPAEDWQSMLQQYDADAREVWLTRTGRRGK